MFTTWKTRIKTQLLSHLPYAEENQTTAASADGDKNILFAFENKMLQENTAGLPKSTVSETEQRDITLWLTW